MQKKQVITSRPKYSDGQLLSAEDFIAEQKFQSHARYQHSMNLHGFGVVSGLEVSPAGDTAISVSPGVAVDRRGREIELAHTETLELNHLSPGTLAWVTIGFRSEPADLGGQVSNRISDFALLLAETEVGKNDVRLGSVQLDERGHLKRDPGRVERDVLKTRLAPGSVIPESLAPQLQRGWVSMPFHPTDVPQDDDKSPPPFRKGATLAEAHRNYAGQPNTKGAGGTMGIVLPPGVRHIHRFMIAGPANEAESTVTLLKGGFDGNSKKHVREEVLTLKIPPGPYLLDESIPDAYRNVGDRLRTLAVDIRSSAYIGISVLGLDVSY